MIKFSKEDLSRIIEMAWEDRTPFEAIKNEFGLDQSQVKKIMKKELKAGSFLVWKKRVKGRKTKHGSLRDFKVGRHQSYDNNKIKSK
ncbi:MAG: TIGR03643 family protein [Gammaproteobacteria bacterium]|mgnify:FL=1|nr:TIGR03643 family protein [Gammaproteobacteria bacterium]|tara:strand:+ start:622 stop:882 length:261 start_codon:yes stop_codon:yes gene_type:complete